MNSSYVKKLDKFKDEYHIHKILQLILFNSYDTSISYFNSVFCVNLKIKANFDSFLSNKVAVFWELEIIFWPEKIINSGHKIGKK